MIPALNSARSFPIDRTNYILTGKSEQEMPDFDTYLTRMGVDDTMKAIVTGYMALPPDKRKTVKEYIESLAAEIAERKAAPAAKDEEPPTPVDKPPADAPPVSDSDTPDGVSDEEWEIIRQLRLEKSTRTTTASRYISSG